MKPVTGHYVYKYVFNNEIIYIGKSDTKNFKRALCHHGNFADNIDTKWSVQLRYSDIYYAPLNNALMTAAAESELIREHNPKCNVAKPRNNGINIDVSKLKWELIKKTDTSNLIRDFEAKIEQIINEHNQEKDRQIVKSNEQSNTIEDYIHAANTNLFYVCDKYSDYWLSYPRTAKFSKFMDNVPAPTTNNNHLLREFYYYLLLTDLNHRARPFRDLLHDILRELVLNSKQPHPYKKWLITTHKIYILSNFMKTECSEIVNTINNRLFDDVDDQTYIDRISKLKQSSEGARKELIFYGWK